MGLDGGADGVARMFDADSGAELWEMRGHAGPISRVKISADGNLVLTTGQDGVARVFAADTDRLMEMAEAQLSRHVGAAGKAGKRVRNYR